jgi:hypothetical protein
MSCRQRLPYRIMECLPVIQGTIVEVTRRTTSPVSWLSAWGNGAFERTSIAVLILRLRLRHYSELRNASFRKARERPYC